MAGRAPAFVLDLCNVTIMTDKRETLYINITLIYRAVQVLTF